MTDEEMVEHFKRTLATWMEWIGEHDTLLSPEELIALLEPYITAAQGRIIQREDESGRRGEPKYHKGEAYD